MARAIISVVNDKGGVGKTTIVVNLAAGLALRSLKNNPDRPDRILLIDLDPSGNALLSVNYQRRLADPNASIYALLARLPAPMPQRLIQRSEHYPNLFFIPTCPEAMKEFASHWTTLPNAQARLARAIGPVAADYDIILIDTPHTITPPFFSNAVTASTHILIPTELSYLAIYGLLDVETELQAYRDAYGLRLPILGYVPSRVIARRNTEMDYLQMLRDRYPDLVFDPLHDLVDAEAAHGAHMDVFAFRPPKNPNGEYISSSPSCQEFGRLVESVAARLNLEEPHDR